MQKSIINVHTHLFTFNHVPKDFIPFQGFILTLLNWLPGFTRYFLSERAELFITRGRHEKQLDILRELAAYYPTGSKFAVHTMDFEYMGSGVSLKRYSFIDQLEELATIKASNEWKDSIYPFICVDPRRPNVVELVKDYIENKGFIGIKLYPSLGFMPTDARLTPLYKWAEENSVPIMVHCSRSGSVYFKGKEGADGAKCPPTMSKKEWANRYVDPDNYIPIFNQYPNIKICFAHFGGELDCLEFYKQGNLPSSSSYISDKTGQIVVKSKVLKPSVAGYENWFLKVAKLLKKHKGAYADISYTSGDEDLMALFHIYSLGEKYDEKNYSLKDKILYGSDFYMAHLTRNERWFSINLRSRFGEEVFWRLIDNNYRYLFGKDDI